MIMQLVLVLASMCFTDLHSREIYLCEIPYKACSSTANAPAGIFGSSTLNSLHSSV
jgi:hypothetical protein